jgi:hypothetical protein
MEEIPDKKSKIIEIESVFQCSVGMLVQVLLWNPQTPKQDKGKDSLFFRDVCLLKNSFKEGTEFTYQAFIVQSGKFIDSFVDFFTPSMQASDAEQVF